MSASTRCITCGHQVGDPPQLNLLENGSNCPTCRDRALDAVPAALPASIEEGVTAEVQGELFPEFGAGLEDDGPDLAG